MPPSTAAEKRSSVGQRPAPAIGAPVRPWRPELVDERVVGGEQLDTVEARCHAPAPRRGRTRRSPPRSRPPSSHGCHRRRACDGNPDGDQCSRNEFAASPCWPTWYSCWIITTPPSAAAASWHVSVRRRKCGTTAVVVGTEVASREDRRGVHGHRLDDDHPGSAERPLSVVGDVALRRQPALAHVRGVGAEVDPAAQRAVAERQWGEHVREVVHHFVLPSSRAPARGSAYARAVAVSRTRQAHERRGDASGGWLVSITTSATISGPRCKRRGAGARTAARRTRRSSATASWRSPAAGDTRSRTSCRRAAPATPASGTTRSPAGCGAGGSTSVPSCCATSRSAPRCLQE